jgi:poly(3-hydroxybutyrate) depolymerase
MKHLAFFALAATALAAPDAELSAKAVGELSVWLKTPRAERKAAGDFAATALTKADAARAAELLWADRTAFLQETRAAEMKEKSITLDGKSMKFETVYFGDKANAPAGGRSLFISMHGGGNAPAQLNESQWRNQIALAKAYVAKEGVYIAPRAPTNTWNLWHEGHIDPMFDRLIEDCVALEGVNPDRVYILGYSAGGDGVYQLAPRMADRWAAASMMAGHPNETSPRGLRNVPFAIQVGELDGAYDRNKIAADWAVKLGDLRKDDPAGYEHFVELHKGRPHWMGTDDRKAIPWMEKFTRNPLPEKIVWRQDDVTHTRMYWLAVPAKQPAAGQEIVAERKGQKFTITLNGAKEVSVLLSDEVANLDEPVVISVDGKEAFHGEVKRTVGTLLRTMEERGDRRLMFSAIAP